MSIVGIKQAVSSLEQFLMTNDRRHVETALLTLRNTHPTSVDHPNIKHTQRGSGPSQSSRVLSRPAGPHTIHSAEQFANMMDYVFAHRRPPQ